MSKKVLETLGTVTPDGVLTLDQQVTVPPGRVKVRVETVEVPIIATEALMEFVERTRREMEAAGSRFMNDDEVTAWIEELRADDDRIDKAYVQLEREHPKQTKAEC